MSNRKKATGKKKFTRSGAAAFALGLFLAGPQAAVAAADDAEGTSSGASRGNSAGSENSQANSTASTTRATSGNRVPSTTRAGSGRPTPAPPAATAAAPDLTEDAASEPTLPELTAPVAPSPDASVPEAAPTEAAPPEPLLPEATTSDATPGAAETTDQATDAAAKADPSPGTTPPTQEPTPEPSDSKFIGSPTSPETAAAFSVHDAGVAAVAVKVDAMKDQPAVFDVRPSEVEDAAIAVQIAAIVPASVALPSAPAAKAAVATPTPKQPTVTAGISRLVDEVFEALSDALAALPAGQLQASLEGALLLVRRNFFNQAPIANPVQEVTTSEGLILGSLAGLDRDGEEITYSVVGDPQFGSISINPDGRYIYTPGNDFTGSDSFTVRIATDGSGFNILNPGRHRVTELTVAIGAKGPTNPFASTSAGHAPVDAALRLADVSATISVARKLGGFTASITLSNVTADTKVLYMDAAGRTGQIPVAEMVSEYWDEFASAAEVFGGGVTLGVVYRAADGTDQTVVLTEAKAAQGSGGQIVFTGDLAPDTRSRPGYGKVNDFWDVMGGGYQAQYQRFREQYISGMGFRPISFDVTSADIYADTYTITDYRAVKQSAEGTGVRLEGPRGPITSAAAAEGSRSETTLSDALLRQAVKFVSVVSPPAPPPFFRDSAFPTVITATLNDSQGVILGFGDGSVRQWDGTTWQSLRPADDPDDPKGPVLDVARLQGGLTVVSAKGVQEWNGTKWTDVEKDQTIQGAFTKTTIKTASGDYYLVTTIEGETRTQLQKYDRVISSGFGQTNKEVSQFDRHYEEFDSSLQAAIPYQGGLIVAMGDGKIYQLGKDGKSATVLRDDSGTFSNTRVTAMAAYKDGFVALQDDSTVNLWTPGAGWAQLTSEPSSGVFDVWTKVGVVGDTAIVGADASATLERDKSGGADVYLFDLQNPGTPPQKTNLLAERPLRAILPYQTGAAIVFGDGMVYQLDIGAGKITYLNGDPLLGAGFTREQDAFPRHSDYSVTLVSTDGENLILSANYGTDRSSISQYVPGKGWNTQVTPVSILGSDDPIFGRAEFQPACKSDNTCTGEFYPFVFAGDPSKPYSVAKFEVGYNTATKKWEPVNRTDPSNDYETSFEASFDMTPALYGYFFVPDGVWDKLSTDKYSAGMLAALTLGPSVSLNVSVNTLEKDKNDPGITDPITIKDWELLSKQLYYLPTEFGTFAIDGALTAGLTAQLNLASNFKPEGDWPKLTAAYYVTPGALLTYNTAGEDGLGFGFNYYTQTKWDFDKITGVEISPNIKPELSLSYGLIFPQWVPYVGGKSLVKATVSVANPVALNLAIPKECLGGPDAPGCELSVTAEVSGIWGYGWSAVDFLTDRFTNSTWSPAYGPLKTDNLIPRIKDPAGD